MRIASLVSYRSLFVSLGASGLFTLATACGGGEDCSDTHSCGEEHAAEGGAAGETSTPSAGTSGEGSGGRGGTASNEGGAPSTGGTNSSQGGEPGEGEGGAPPAPACESDEACDDGDGCNGVEACFDGACVAGEPPCEEQNGDPQNCDAICTDLGAGQIECGVRAKDADGDEHGSKLCALDPSPANDDCDDSAASVHPLAEEACNGVDDDCDGKIDTDDGLPLSGTFDDFSNGSGDLVWSPQAQQFAYFSKGEGGDSGTLWFRTVSESGAISPQSKKLYTFNARQGEPVRAVWGGDSFGVVWREGLTNRRQVKFARFTAAGEPVGQPLVVSGSNPMNDEDNDGLRPFLARAGTGSWMLGWELDERIESTFQSVSASGNVDEGDRRVFEFRQANLAALGQKYLLVGYNPDEHGVQLLLGSPLKSAEAENFLAPALTTEPSHEVVVAANERAQGFGVALQEPQGTRFGFVTASGALSCEEVITDGFPWDVDAFEDGFLVTTNDELLYVNSTCEVVRKVAYPAYNNSRVSTAVSPNGVIGIAAGGDITVVGKNFCD